MKARKVVKKIAVNVCIQKQITQNTSPSACLFAPEFPLCQAKQVTVSATSHNTTYNFFNNISDSLNPEWPCRKDVFPPGCAKLCISQAFPVPPLRPPEPDWHKHIWLVLMDSLSTKVNPFPWMPLTWMISHIVSGWARREPEQEELVCTEEDQMSDTVPAQDCTIQALESRVE